MELGHDDHENVQRADSFTFPCDVQKTQGTGHRHSSASPDGCTATSVGARQSTGFTRWSVNVALQSFIGEPWALEWRYAKSDSEPVSTDHVPMKADPTKDSATPGPLGSGLSSEADTYQAPLTGIQRDAQPLSPALGRSLSVHASALHSKDAHIVQQCVDAVNATSTLRGGANLIRSFSDLQFERVVEAAPGKGMPDAPPQYRLRSPLEPLLTSTIKPAVSAVMDRCVSSMILVYSATLEMKQWGLIGTPKECGLLPHGIRMLMGRFVEQVESQKQPRYTGSAVAATSTSPTAVSVSDGEAVGGAGVVDGNGYCDLADGTADDLCSNRKSKSAPLNHVQPGTSTHCFVRAETSFIAFDSTNVVDLLDLSNHNVVPVLKVAPQPTPVVFEDFCAEDIINGAPSGLSDTTDSFTVGASVMHADTVNDALVPLDLGLENLSRALEMSRLQSEFSSSLLFRLTLYTDNCRSASMYMLCLAEDPPVQEWLASTVLARSQAIPEGDEASWASIQNAPMPPALHHNAATLLVPILCFGNIFTSVLVCVYNSIAALARLHRDLYFAVMGTHMCTIPRVTPVNAHRVPQSLPPGWVECLTNDGRPYYVNTSTQRTTWEVPCLPHQATEEQRPSVALERRRPSRIALGEGDKDFLSICLRAEGTSPPLPTDPSCSALPAAGVGILVTDPRSRPRVLLHSKGPEFATQWIDLQRHLNDRGDASLLVGSNIIESALSDSKRMPWMGDALEATADYHVEDLDPHSSSDNPGNIKCDSRKGEDLRKIGGTSGKSHEFFDAVCDMPLIEFECFDDDVRTEEKAGYGAVVASPRADTIIPDTDDDLASIDADVTDVENTVNTAIFYENALKHKMATTAVNLADSLASSTQHAGDSIRSNNAGSCSGTSTVTITAEMQEVESLVDEFSRFFQYAYENEKRLQALEATMSFKHFNANSCTMHTLLRQMEELLSASGSALLQEGLRPFFAALPSCGSDPQAVATALGAWRQFIRSATGTVAPLPVSASSASILESRASATLASSHANNNEIDRLAQENALLRELLRVNRVAVDIPVASSICVADRSTADGETR